MKQHHPVELDYLLLASFKLCNKIRTEFPFTAITYLNVNGKCCARPIIRFMDKSGLYNLSLSDNLFIRNPLIINYKSMVFLENCDKWKKLWPTILRKTNSQCLIRYKSGNEYVTRIVNPI